MIGSIVMLAGDDRLFVVTDHRLAFLICTPVGGGEPVTCKRRDVKKLSVEQLLIRYEDMSVKAKVASYAYNAVKRRRNLLQELRKVYMRRTR